MATPFLHLVPDITLSGGDEEHRFFEVTAPGGVDVADLLPGLHLPFGTLVMVQQTKAWTAPNGLTTFDSHEEFRDVAATKLG